MSHLFIKVKRLAGDAFPSEFLFDPFSGFEACHPDLFWRAKQTVNEQEG